VGAARLAFVDGSDYDARFDVLAAAGRYLHGEADLVVALGGHRVLDAGCGTGRVAIELARRGLDVVGVDVDPSMLDRARAKAPELDWRLVDLATDPVDGDPFDLVLMAGNVVLFTPPGTEPAVVATAAAALLPGGRLVAGFALHDDTYGLGAYDRDCAAAGLDLEARWGTWERGDFTEGGDYAVSVHVRTDRR
jgi:SAM-dependent methyltransferase